MTSTAPCSKNTSSRRSSRPRTPLKIEIKRADDARRVLDRAHRGVLDVVAEHVARARVDARGRAEQPREDVGAVDRVLEQRAAARVRALRPPRAVTRDDVAGRPVLVVAQRVAHRRAELVARRRAATQLVDQRMEARVEADLRGRVPTAATSCAHLANDRRSASRAASRTAAACRRRRRRARDRGASSSV